MNFASERDMNNAMSKLKMTVRRKLRPKIMICNVYKNESKDELIRNLTDRNYYLKTIEDV